MTKESSTKPAVENVLTINGGSSSIKFALYQASDRMQRILMGNIDRIGSSVANLAFNDTLVGQQGQLSIEATNNSEAANFLIEWLGRRIGFAHIVAVGHRVVHGMKRIQPERVSQSLLDELHRNIPYDPDHLPLELELIEAFCRHYPQLPQVACFDTSFHHSLPRVARILPIPRRFDALGIQRYGFHGLSCAYLMQALSDVAGTKVAQGRVILAHLGNGASLTAVRYGESVDTSMGFTPAAGLPMGTRPGDLDPGVAWYMMMSESLTPEQFNKLINHESGLLGMSELSADMRDLLEHEKTDLRAAETIEVFCYQVKKWIGAYTAALGGLDTLVFAGGIGENAPVVRARICAGFEFLGIEIDETRNLESAGVISTATSRVSVRVIHTDEEVMIAKSVCQVLGLPREEECEHG